MFTGTPFKQNLEPLSGNLKEESTFWEEPGDLISTLGLFGALADDHEKGTKYKEQQDEMILCAGE